MMNNNHYIPVEKQTLKQLHATYDNLLESNCWSTQKDLLLKHVSERIAEKEAAAVARALKEAAIPESEKINRLMRDLRKRHYSEDSEPMQMLKQKLECAVNAEFCMRIDVYGGKHHGK